MQKTFEQSVDVNVPAAIAYSQWTQFETFPEFMSGVEEVIQESDDTLFWRAEIAGVTQEWHAKITEQIPDQRIAWASINGAHHAGVVTFHRLDDESCRVMLQIEYNPEGFIENVGAALGIVEGRMAQDMEAFKNFIERRDVPTGRWTGEIPQQQT